VFENRVLRRIAESKKSEITREWRKLHTKELQDLYSSPHNMQVIKSKKKDIVRASGTYRRQEGCIQGLVGSGEGKRPLERVMHTWGDNIKTDLQ